MNTKGSFDSKEKRVVLIVAFIIFSRMSALFFPLPVFSPLASNLAGSTPFLVGLAIGIYALMQAGLQIPLGWLSDQIGRKKVIFVGLLIFLLGSVLAAVSNDIYSLIIARLIQGLGAISSTLTALIADQTRINQRAKAMAIIGASVGVAFFICTLTSGLIVENYGFSAIFWLISALSLLSLMLSFLLSSSKPSANTQNLDFKITATNMIKNSTLFTPKLLYLDSAVFVGHFILSANFFILPLLLINTWGFELSEHWKVYLFVLVFSIPAMIYTVYLVDKAKRITRAFNFALIALIACHLIFQFPLSFIYLLFGMLIFFAGFSSLETLLPTLASANSQAHNKGLVMGIFNTHQQLGSALGAIVAGLIGFDADYLIFAVNFLLVVCLFLFGIKIYPQFNLSEHKIET